MAQDDGLLHARLEDMMADTGRTGRPRFLGFLTPAERVACEEFLGKAWSARCAFFGGYEDAERTLLGLGTERAPPAEDFPVAALTAVWRDHRPLSHRDLLGGLLALGIRRDCVGDIAVRAEERRAVLFVSETVAGLIRMDFRSAGRTEVTLTDGIPADMSLEPMLEPLVRTVASVRLDCVLAAMLDVSRSEAVAMIGSGLARPDGRACLKPDAVLNEGVVLSVRGRGKYRVDEIGGLTRKGRIRLKYSKYI